MYLICIYILIINIMSILSTIIYGLLLVLFLMFFPTGLAGLWARVRRFFANWPFAN